MLITPLKITIRDLSEGYKDNEENGVVAYGGKLDVRPPFQRNFVYKDKQRDAVITTVKQNYPLNVMYWAEKEDGSYEIIDGQQRTISICQYINGDFAHDFLAFHNLDKDAQDKILDYELNVYVCSGENTEKLKWFETINISGVELTPQELKNAVYSGSFVTDAKRYFSKSNCPASLLGKDLVNGTADRQELLEVALKWICDKEGISDIRLYMSKHQHDPNATMLWSYYQTVLNWVHNNFNVSRYNKILKGLDWNKWYEMFKDTNLDKDKIESEMKVLSKDSEVSNRKGIVPYILTGKENYLALRTFGDDIKERIYEKQKGICPICGEHFQISEMEADHIKPWCKGGKTEEGNCQMLCIHCNRTKSGK